MDLCKLFHGADLCADSLFIQKPVMDVILFIWEKWGPCSCVSPSLSLERSVCEFCFHRLSVRDRKEEATLASDRTPLRRASRAAGLFVGAIMACPLSRGVPCEEAAPRGGTEESERKRKGVERGKEKEGRLCPRDPRAARVFFWTPR